MVTTSFHYYRKTILFDTVVAFGSLLCEAYMSMYIHKLCFLAICVPVYVISYIYNNFFLNLLQSQYWPHLSFKTNVHIGGLKPRLSFQAFLVIIKL